MAKRNKLNLRKERENGWKTPFLDYLIYLCLTVSGLLLVVLVILAFLTKTDNFQVISLFIKDIDFLKIHFVTISGILVFLIGSICLLLMKNRGKTMTCPRCIGKGFVDLNDIKRLGKEEDWIQGCCKYCDGNGEVIKGKTTLLSPIWTDDQIEDTEFDLWNYEEE